MSFAQLMGRYQRLKKDLATAYNARPWHSARINRLADDLSATERELKELVPSGFECSTPACELSGTERPTSRERSEEIGRMD